MKRKTTYTQTIIIKFNLRVKTYIYSNKSSGITRNAYPDSNNTIRKRKKGGHTRIT